MILMQKVELKFLLIASPMSASMRRRTCVHLLLFVTNLLALGGAYNLLHHSNMPNPDVMLIWSTKLPTKVKFFAWLLCHGRLNTRDIFTAAPSGLSRSLTANAALLLLSLTSTSSSTVPWHKALGVRLVLLQIQPLYDSLGYSVLVLISLTRCVSTSSCFSFGISGRHVMR